MSVSLVAPARNCAQPAIPLVAALYRGRAVSGMAGDEVAAASEYRALQQQVRELQRLFGKKILKNEI